MGRMSRFTTRWDTVDTLPDWHLVQALWIPTSRGLHVPMHFRADHVHPELVRDLDEYFRHLANSEAYVIEPERATDPPEFITIYERVRPEWLPLTTFSLRIHGDHYLFLVRADMMSAPMVNEINDYILGSKQGALRSARRTVPTAANGAPSLLDRYADELMTA